MKKLFYALPALAVACAPGPKPDPDVARWEAQAQNVTIIRDDWGIAHVHGKTDADAVFGVLYAQAEDDFNRVETNYINAMGRLAEAEGEGQIWRDLRMKLFIDPDSMKAIYAASPDSLKVLMNAFADGLNYYLHTHPDVKPRVITHFEPWMALTFSEGSIGGDIERVNLRQLEAFYGKHPVGEVAEADDDGDGPAEPTGSNGFAIAPANTKDGHALLWINPHTSFFFRSELQATSDQGLDAYGAVTWGQFFIYQGFNAHAGWMHTSSGVDNIDEYAETIVKQGDSLFYKYGTELRPVIVSTIAVPFKTDTGMATRTFTVFKTHHGPVVRAADGKWITVRLMQEPMKALTQSYYRTKTTDYQSFRQVMELHTNSSNNTVFADGKGNIAYFHSNFIPKRDTRFDWSKPVDGSNPATEWMGVHSIDETPNAFNPPNGWIQNTNNWPYSVAGPNSPKQKDYPAYMESGGENPRGIHAIRVLSGKKDFTMESLRDAAFDSYLTEFAILVPRLLDAYRKTASGPLKQKLAEPIDSLAKWDLRWGAGSVPTAVAVFWGRELFQGAMPEVRKSGGSPYDYIEHASAAEQLAALAAAVDTLTADFGTWKTPWGDINRFQRIDDAIDQVFDDSKPSIPVPFTSSRWGSLASFGTAPRTAQARKLYGTSGNSFVAAVEFGDSVKAIAITAGGESGHPTSKHFNDEAERYASGNLRPVYFYPNQLVGHTERTYHPGGTQ